MMATQPILEAIRLSLNTDDVRLATIGEIELAAVCLASASITYPLQDSFPTSPQYTSASTRPRVRSTKSWTISQFHGGSPHEISSEMTAGEGARQELPDAFTSDISDLLSSSSRVHDQPAMDLMQNHPADLRENPVMNAETEKAETQSPLRESANLNHQVVDKRQTTLPNVLKPLDTHIEDTEEMVIGSRYQSVQ
ncbi:hypothetical protein XANCAGTX0491_006051 [Xanthoria calcicola]